MDVGKRDWSAVASSSDGMSLVAAAAAGNLWTSSDGGGWLGGWLAGWGAWDRGRGPRTRLACEGTSTKRSPRLCCSAWRAGATRWRATLLLDASCCMPPLSRPRKACAGPPPPPPPPPHPPPTHTHHPPTHPHIPPPPCRLCVDAAHRSRAARLALDGVVGRRPAPGRRRRRRLHLDQQRRRCARRAPSPLSLLRPESGACVRGLEARCCAAPRASQAPWPQAPPSLPLLLDRFPPSCLPAPCRRHLDGARGGGQPSLDGPRLLLKLLPAGVGGQRRRRLRRRRRVPVGQRRRQLDAGRRRGRVALLVRNRR